MHEANFHVTGFSYGSNTRDAMGNVSRSRGSLRRGCHRRLQLDTGRRRLQSAIKARVPALILHLSARDTGHRHREHLQLEGKPRIWNASVDDTDTAVVATFFCATDGKSFVPTFNCFIRNTSKCLMTHLLVHLCLQASIFVGRTRLRRWGSKYGRIR
jgi:hypothetical protein